MTGVVALIVLAGSVYSGTVEAQCDRHVAFFAPLAEWARASSKPAELISRIEGTLDEVRRIQRELKDRRSEQLAPRLEAIQATHQELRRALASELGGVIVDVSDPLPAPCVVLHATLTLDRNPIFSSDEDLNSVSGWSWSVYLEALPPGRHTLAARMVLECTPGEKEHLSGDLTFSIERGRTIKVETLAARPGLTIRVVPPSR